MARYQLCIIIIIIIIIIAVTGGVYYNYASAISAMGLEFSVQDFAVHQDMFLMFRF